MKRTMIALLCGLMLTGRLLAAPQINMDVLQETASATALAPTTATAEAKPAATRAKAKTVRARVHATTAHTTSEARAKAAPVAKVKAKAVIPAESAPESHAKTQNRSQSRTRGGVAQVQHDTKPEVALPAAGLGVNKAGAQTPTPEIQITLERVRVNRSRIFNKTPEEIRPTTPMDLSNAAQEAEMWFPALSIQFRITPPRDWDVIDVSQATVVKASDQNGRPLVNLTATGEPQAADGSKMTPLVPMLQKVNNGALVLVRTEPPLRDTTSFKDLVTRFTMALGYKRSETVENIRPKVGQTIYRLADPQGGEMTLELLDIGRDLITLRGMGNTTRLGAVRFTDMQGKTLDPYTVELNAPEDDKSGQQPVKEWDYSFTQLPSKINMVVETYPVARQKTVTIRFPNVPLP